MESQPIEQLASLGVSGWTLSHVSADADGLRLCFIDPAVEAASAIERGALHVTLGDWCWLEAMRPSFAPIARVDVSDEPAWIEARLDRTPRQWYSAAERAATRRVRLYDAALAVPVLELAAATFSTIEGPARSW